jgi:hypothetical protein
MSHLLVRLGGNCHEDEASVLGKVKGDYVAQRYVVSILTTHGESAGNKSVMPYKKLSFQRMDYVTGKHARVQRVVCSN